MKISDYKIGTVFEITCVKEYRKGMNIYNDFGISKQHSYLWGHRPEDVITVKMTIIENDVCIKNLYASKDYDSNSIDYFGHIDFDPDGLHIGCIFPNIKLFNICFPYGADASPYWEQDIMDPITKKTIHHKGDRRSMNVRLKVEEI